MGTAERKKGVAREGPCNARLRMSSDPRRLPANWRADHVRDSLMRWIKRGHPPFDTRPLRQSGLHLPAETERERAADLERTEVGRVRVACITEVVVLLLHLVRQVDAAEINRHVLV